LLFAEFSHKIIINSNKISTISTKLSKLTPIKRPKVPPVFATRSKIDILGVSDMSVYFKSSYKYERRDFEFEMSLKLNFAVFSRIIPIIKIFRPILEILEYLSDTIFGDV
jgi:hypothetical protein